MSDTPPELTDLAAEKAPGRPLLALVLLGIAARLAVVALAGNELIAWWSGGSDAPAYVTLASNIAEGRGFSYAGQPTAFRPPLYPLLLAGMMRAFGSHYVLAMRVLQFVAGLLTAYLCWRLGRRMFSREAARGALVFTLFLPTLVYFSGEMLTECLAALATAIFLHYLLAALAGERTAAWGLGATVGLGSLLRFTTGACVLIAAPAAIHAAKNRKAWLRPVLVFALAAAIFSPWLVRNRLVFGEWLISTQTGGNALTGLLAPQGRALPEETARLKEAAGWLMQDLETNGPSRATLPSEPELNRDAWQKAKTLWRKENARLLPLLVKKLGYFWLSTDQLVGTQHLSERERLLRAALVVPYWVVLGLAVVGWIGLRRRQPHLAKLLAYYSLLMTTAHILFAMNTRLRTPLFEPLLAVLAGGGWVALKARRRPWGADQRLDRAESGA